MEIKPMNLNEINVCHDFDEKSRQTYNMTYPQPIAGAMGFNPARRPTATALRQLPEY